MAKAVRQFTMSQQSIIWKKEEVDGSLSLSSVYSDQFDICNPAKEPYFI